MVTVYILQSLKDNRYYIGITKDVNNRLIQHNKGSVGSTKNRRPFRIVCTEQFSDYKNARLREIEIKRYKGGVAFKKLVGK